MTKAMRQPMGMLRKGEPPLELAVELPPIPNLKARRRQRGYSAAPAAQAADAAEPAAEHSGCADTRKRSGLPARDFG